MKKLLISLFSLFLFGQLFAQSYSPMVLDSSVWNCVLVNSNGPSSANFYPYTRVLLSDTLINNQLYKRDNRKPISYFREDTIQQKVYGITQFQDSTGNFVLSSESLIYDFTLQVGDTFKVKGVQQVFDTITLIVSTVDSVIDLDSNYRKQIALDIFNPLGLMKSITWVEGVGAIDYDLYYPSDLSLYDWHTLNTVYCYSNANRQVFENPYVYWSSGSPVYYNCGTITNVSSEKDDALNSLNLFPNPVKNKLSIQGLASEQIRSVRVFDLLGNAFQINVEKRSGSALQLNTSQLAKGIYLIQIETESGFIAKKIVKQ